MAAFAVMAAVLVLLAIAAWYSMQRAHGAQAELRRQEQLLVALDEWRQYTRVDPNALLCLGGSASRATAGAAAVADGAAPSPATRASPAALANGLERLSAWAGALADSPAEVQSWQSFKGALESFDTDVLAPVRETCAATTAEVKSLSTLQERWLQGLERRAELDRQFAYWHTGLSQAIEQSDRRRATALKFARFWQGLLTLAALVTAAAAVLAVRGFVNRLADVQRVAADERHERELAKDELTVSQRRMRVLVDHVRDAVIAFDAKGHMQWINPAGEAMFGAERDALLGFPITLLMPELEAEMRAASAPDATTLTDELGLPWVSRQLTLQGVKPPAAAIGDRADPKALAGAPRITLDVSFVQTRVQGHVVGVCVARDLSALRLLQRRYDDLASSLRHRVLPELRTAHAATSERAAPVVLADGDPQTPVWLTGRGVEPNEAPRRAIESAIRLLEQLVQPPRQP